MTMHSRVADTLLVNGKVITVNDQFHIASGLAIAGERIMAVGRDEFVRSLSNTKTRIIDLQGRAVVPGLIDGHAHLDREGLKSVFPSLGPVRSIADIQDRIAELVCHAQPGDWIVTMPIGDPPYYWNVPDILAEKRFPNRFDLDKVAPRNPVYIRPIWGFWRHTPPLVSIANSSALQQTGITRDTQPPAASVTIEKDPASGEPTGVFYENTMMPIVELTLMRLAPGFMREHRAEKLPESFQAYHAFGTTSVFEEHGAAAELIRAYKDARARGTLTMRTALVLSPNWQGLANVPLSDFIPAWCAWLGEPALGDEWLRMTGLFVDIDGSDENRARTKALPYTGWAGFNYDTALSRERAREILIACAQNEIRVVAIWPNMLELFAEVHRSVPLNGKRWVLGHISTLSERDIDRIAEMELVVSAHTNRYVYKEGHLLQKRLGPDRENEIAPLRSLMEKGTRVSLGTDNVPVSMFYPIWQAVTRFNHYTRAAVAPGQKLTREQALRAATINGAWLTFEEGVKGSLEPGKLADVAVLSADPLSVPEDALKDIRADVTMVGGRVVYEEGRGDSP
jgi:predicted amidohydrolase YtcJ